MLAEFADDTGDLYLAAGRGGTNWTELLLHHHAPGWRAWKLGLLALNGQVDARWWGVATLAFQLAAIGALLGVLVRSLRWGVPLLLALGAAGALALSVDRAIPPIGAAAAVSGLILFSVLHLALSAPLARPWQRWLGLACGVLNVLMATEGIASAAALVLWSVVESRRAGPAERTRQWLWANIALLVLGLALAAVRLRAGFGLAATPPISDGWSGERVVEIAIFWAPVLAILVRWSGGRGGARTPALAARWALGAGLLAVIVGVLPGSEIRGDLFLWWCGFLVNAAFLAGATVRSRRGRTGWFAFGLLWCVTVIGILTQPPPGTGAGTAGPEQDSPLAAALRRAAVDGDLTDLRSAAAPATVVIENLGRNLAQPEIRRILPPSIRPSLPMRPDEGRGPDGFQVDGAPALLGRNGLPVVGTWSPEGTAITGEFRSGLVNAELPFVQIRVCGQLTPPGTELVLQRADGAEIAPLERAVTSTQRWKRVNFAKPAGAFRIVARDRSATEWLAITAPVEVGRWSRFAGKVLPWWTWLLAGAALGGGLAAAVVVWNAWRALLARLKHPTEALLNWRLVPWLLCAGYALFLMDHLDTAAGPNDSGGYLNSAKLLAQGRIAATPRMLFGPAQGETDITPYLPVTFLPTRDGQMVPTYPVGIPLIVAAGAQVFSLDHAVAVNVFAHFLLGIVFTWLVARAFGLPDGWAWLAAGIVGLSPVYLHQALQPLSDGPALVWVTAAVYWAWTSREHPSRAWLAGAATALAVLIRPANLLCVLPVALCLVGDWRRLAAWVLGGLPGAVWLLWYQHTLYGGWGSTGYGEDVSSFFGLQFVGPTLQTYAIWLTAAFTPVVWLGFVGLFERGMAVRTRWVLGAWAGVFLAFYAVYWCTWDTWFNMRFVLPAMPAVLVLALSALRGPLARAGLRLFGEARHPAALVATGALVAVVVCWQIGADCERRVLLWSDGNRGHAVVGRWVQDHLPGDAVVFARNATGPLHYYTDRQFVRSDHESLRDASGFFARIVATGRPLYALNYHWEGRGFSGRGHGDGRPDLPGEWDCVGPLWRDDIYLWKWRRPTGSGPAPGGGAGSTPIR